MALLRLNHSDPRYQAVVGNADLSQFNVYTARNEPVGKVVDILTDDVNQTHYFVIDLSMLNVNKQVLFPIGQLQIDPRAYQMHLLGLSKTQLLNQPPFYLTDTGSQTPNYGESTNTQPIRTAINELPTQQVATPSVNNQPQAFESSNQRVEPTRQFPVGIPSQIATDRSHEIQPTDQTYPKEQPFPSSINSQSQSLERHPVIEEPRQSREYESQRAMASEPSTGFEDAVKHWLASNSVINDETIRLLEERLVVDREKHKVGEVIVRKAIETQMIEVPVRREKLIIEQVSPEHKQLASIDLDAASEGRLELTPFDEIDSQPTSDTSAEAPQTVTGQFPSAVAASNFLQAIAAHPHKGYSNVQISFTVTDPEVKETYQQWINQYSELR